MRESISNSMIFTWVMTFVAIIIAFLIGSISYSKAYKIRNRIINIIEANEGYSTNAQDEIEEFLGRIGYRTSNQRGCPNLNGFDLKTNLNTIYRYCVYEKQDLKGKYYKVVAYMYFDLPMLGESMEFPVNGETKVIYDLMNL